MRRSILAGAAAGLGIAAASVGAGIAAYEAYSRLRPRISAAGKVVLITGSSRGLGLAMAREFAAQGVRLVLCARDEQELALAAESLTAAGAEVMAIPCDVTVQEDVVRMVNDATARFGGIDILINNAGIIAVGPVPSQTLVDYHEAMDVMFWGVVYPALAVLPQMMRRGSGHIGNITSIGGKISVPHLVPYGCAKFAAVGFSEGLRAELARYGIRVTTIVPGLMRTGSHLNAYFKGKHRQEFTWFSMGATLPGIAMDARRAAGKIVRAVLRGQAEIVLTPQAKVAVLAHGVAPGLTADILGWVNRLLPERGDSAVRHTGSESETALTRSFLTRLGREAAREFNQEPARRLDPGVA
jgi:short-subunit dehydrogenase